MTLRFPVLEGSLAFMNWERRAETNRSLQLFGIWHHRRISGQM